MSPDQSREVMKDLKASVEEPKVAVRINRPAALLRCLIHLTPVAMTLGILQFSFRAVYWQDIGASDSQNSIIDGLQFVAKFHEACIMASLSEMVLHRIQYDLSAGEGVPFGLLTAGYQVSSTTYIWSREFWAGVLNQSHRRVYARRVILLMLVFFATILASVAGPSSAITLVPNLDWWEALYPGLATQTFIANSTSELWPRNLTSDIVRADCSSPGAWARPRCPAYGALYLSKWNSLHLSRKPNLTVDVENTSMVRYLSASSDLFNSHIQNNSAPSFRRGYSVATTVCGVLAKYLSLSYMSLPPRLLVDNRPVLTVARPHMAHLFKPFVQVQCQSNPFPHWHNMAFPHSYLLAPPMNEYVNETWAVPNRSWSDLVDNSGKLKSGTLRVSWVDLSSIAHGPSVGVVTITNHPQHPPRMVSCTVDARWFPVRMWIDPNKDNAIHEDHDELLDPKAFPYGTSPSSTEARQISFHQPWIAALAVQHDRTHRTVIEWLFTKHLGIRHAIVDLDTMSFVLGIYIAEALARIHISTKAYGFPYENAYKTNVTVPIEVGKFTPRKWTPGVNVTAEGWTELQFSALKYGYGWSLRGTTVRLAISVLLLHALMCIIHITGILYTGWTSSFMTTISAMTALATNSQPTRNLKNTSVGIDRLSTWKKNVRVREMNDEQMELVFEDGSDEEEIGIKVMPGKEY